MKIVYDDQGRIAEIAFDKDEDQDKAWKVLTVINDNHNKTVMEIKRIRAECETKISAQQAEVAKYFATQNAEVAKLYADQASEQLCLRNKLEELESQNKNKKLGFESMKIQ